MTMTEPAAGVQEPLQFDLAETAAQDTSTQPGAGGVQCSSCNAAVETEYFQVNGVAVCPRCRESLGSALAKPAGWDRFAVAALLGLGSAIAGAIVYYAVIAFLNLEIGIVAILIGYMVGYGVRTGASGRGGRRFQILAVVLTYWAVGLAYSPLAFKDLSLKDPKSATTASVDSVRTPAGGSGNDGSIVVALAFMFAFIFALPMLMVVGSFPSGLISAFIIGLGMRQAWRMTSAMTFEISGPYKVGAVRSALPA
jgi:hypothetical protein